MRVVLVLHPANVAALPDSVHWLVECGADDLVINPDWSASWDDTLLESWTSAYERVASMYVDAFRQGRPFWISTLDPKIATHIRGGYTDADRCDLGRRNLVVAPSGNLYPCDRLVGEDNDHRHVLGHVDTGPDLPRVEGFASAVIDMPAECVTCAIRSRCRNRCACANLALTGNAASPSSLLCFHEQLCLRTADDVAETLYAEANELFIRRHYGSGVRLDEH